VLEGIPTVVRTIKGADVDPTYAGTGFPKGEDVRALPAGRESCFVRVRP
jgi:hypothetical protein